MRFLTAFVLIALALAAPATAAAFPTAAPVATAALSGVATPNAGAMQALALRVFTDLQANKMDRTLFTDRYNAQDLTDRSVAILSRKLAPLGKPSAFVLKYGGASDGDGTSIYRVVSADGRSFVLFSLSFDAAQGKIDSLTFGSISKQ